MTVPQIQDAVVVEKVGGPEVLEYRKDYPVPVPQEGQVLVKNEVSGVNYVDTYFRNGLYPSSKPEVLGREGAGVVVAVGPGINHYNLHIGDRVVWIASSGSTGGYAQYSAVSAQKTIKIPETVPIDDAVASFMVGLTVLSLVNETYQVKEGDWVLVHAAAGSVGLLMVQVLKHLRARIIATAGGPEKVSIVKELGVDHVIDYRSEEGRDWPRLVKEITGGRGVDVVFDSVAKDTWEGSLEAVRRKGMVVWFGNASGPVPPLVLHRLAPKCIKIARPTLGGYIETREEIEHYSNELFSLLATGKLKVRIHKIYPLTEAQQAHRDIESRNSVGKLLLKP